MEQQERAYLDCRPSMESVKHHGPDEVTVVDVCLERSTWAQMERVETESDLLPLLAAGRPSIRPSRAMTSLG